MQNNNIKNLISVPRSGQHVTEQALRIYYKLIAKEYYYCEYYSCCNCRPCKKCPSAYQKNHDFQIGTKNEIKINDTEKYIFFFRDNILQQIESHYRLTLVESKKIPHTNLKIDYNNLIKINNFKKFIIQHIEYYKKIYVKYLNYKNNNMLHIEYDNYIKNFSSSFEKILDFFDLPIDKIHIQYVKAHIQPELLYKISSEDSYYNELNIFIHEEMNKID